MPQHLCHQQATKVALLHASSRIDGLCNRGRRQRWQVGTDTSGTKFTRCLTGAFKVSRRISKAMSATGTSDFRALPIRNSGS